MRQKQDRLKKSMNKISCFGNEKNLNAQICSCGIKKITSGCSKMRRPYILNERNSCKVLEAVCKTWLNECSLELCDDISSGYISSSVYSISTLEIM